MTVHTRMQARSDREKDLLKYGRRQERERIIKLLEDSCTCAEECYCTFNKAYDLIKGEQK